ncbi:hypothetical protein GA0061098_103444 [Bradyrhizobium shewense]|uniref:Uncharacterized protein n=1 Tax=Bradyrhizobium shewense TaxID=1761772 RepID=A0A1C3XS32_9BRAD|nr:hypothetical protein GA0061098_103444 [Bradyrhizobium shewense]
MEPESFKEFCQEFTREVNRLRIERGADIVAQGRELERTERELDKTIQAILEGVPGTKLKEKIGALGARKAELADLLANAEEPPPLLHPNMAEIYHQRVAALYESLQSEGERAEAAEVCRTLVDRVTLVPDESVQPRRTGGRVSSSPRSQYRPAIISRASRASSIGRCSSAACWWHPG